MKVTLRQRKKNYKISLYLDYYHKGKRKTEYLRLYLTPNPKTKTEREVNKKTKQLAETICAQRQIEIQNGKIFSYATYMILGIILFFSFIFLNF